MVSPFSAARLMILVVDVGNVANVGDVVAEALSQRCTIRPPPLPAHVPQRWQKSYTVMPHTLFTLAGVIGVKTSFLAVKRVVKR